MKTHLIATSILFVIFGLIGCSTNSSDTIERTYPEAFNFEQTTTQKIINKEVSPPDSVNLEAYVIGISVCPPESSCFLPDGIIVSDSLHSQTTQSQLRLTVAEPRQFKKDEKYTISLGVTRRSPISDIIDVNLIGYSQLQRNN